MFRATRLRSTWTRHRRAAEIVAGGALLVSAPLFLQKVKNDVKVNSRILPTGSEAAGVPEKDLLENLTAYSWGSNASSTPLTAGSSSDTRKIPTETRSLSGVALRDVIIHETLSTLVDASGDVYRWDVTAGSPPTCVLKGKDIKSLAASSNKLFALSKSGKIYHLDSSSSIEDSGPQSTGWFSFLWPAVETNVLGTSVALSRGERFSSLSAGRDHLLAVTSAGRTFTHPTSLNANSHGQLGTRKVQILKDSESSVGNDEPTTVELSPKVQIDPYAFSSPFVRTGTQTAEMGSTKNAELVPMLYEIPSLRGVGVQKAVANDRSSYVLTKDSGRVLAWGANEFGQLGLGGTAVVPVVSVPAEVTLSKNYPSGSSVRCTDIVSGGNVAFFTVENSNALGNTAALVDVLACGMGQYGALGNGSYTQAQNTPVKVKNVSGNVMFNEKTNSIEPIRPHSFVASPTGHALISLSSGRDLMTWGANNNYALGTGKRAAFAVPTYMRDFALTASGLPDTVDENTQNQGRMTLRSGTLKDLRDLSGRRVGKNVHVQQWPVAGWNASAVYWRVHA